jgi:hypothetical protein
MGDGNSPDQPEAPKIGQTSARALDTVLKQLSDIIQRLETLEKAVLGG